MADRSREGRNTQAKFFHSLVSPFFRYTVRMFQSPQSQRIFVIRCKGCGENIPALVETLPASWIAAKCPLCSEHRRSDDNLASHSVVVARSGTESC
jgi:hypothetical protein